MKNLIKFLSGLVMMVVIGLILTTCDEGSGNPACTHDWGEFVKISDPSFISRGIETASCKVTGCIATKNNYFGEQQKIMNNSDWNAARALITKAGEYTLVIGSNFSVSGSTAFTFGSITNISVTILGNNYTMTLSSVGNMLRINANQTVTMDDLKFAGFTSNNASVVDVQNNNVTFIMKGNSSISGNTRSSSSTWGVGGWFCSGVLFNSTDGTFIMQDNASISNNIMNMTIGNYEPPMVSIVYCAGGVHIQRGNFIMRNNTSIFGNIINCSRAPDSGSLIGGGVVLYSGTFRFIGGIIYGNDASPSSLRNTTNFGSAAFARQGTATYGGVNGTSFNLASSSNTISVP
ncbi:MAG: hypothetical protein FWD47_07325 [Treponema sp.]|nr:hypothetical protein [Treponema sp.]